MSTKTGAFNWTTATWYNQNCYIYDSVGSKYYKVLTANQSSQSTFADELSTNPSYYEEVPYFVYICKSAYTSANPTFNYWANDTAYYVGDYIQDYSSLEYFKCIQNHTSAGSGSFYDDWGNNRGYWDRAQIAIEDMVNNSTNWIITKFNNGSSDGIPETLTQALTKVQELSFAGYSDWRVPNIHELCSIIDYENLIWFSPIVDLYGQLWSSTSYIYGGASYCVKRDNGMNIDFITNTEKKLLHIVRSIN
jgi:hypothetical protein